MARSPIIQDCISKDSQPIKTVEMHTTGEPTRIIYSGFPQLQGATLLEKRAAARNDHDHVRRKLMLEPRGHSEMYGALLVTETELTTKGEADIGVLFMHNSGWSLMCGHATIALGRFLVDFDSETCSDLRSFRIPPSDEEKQVLTFKLHCPCGVIDVCVPVTVGSQGRRQSDPERPVTFLSVDSFATGIDVEVSIPPMYR